MPSLGILISCCTFSQPRLREYDFGYFYCFSLPLYQTEFFFLCPIYDCILMYLGWLMSCKQCVFIFFLLSGRWYYVWTTEDDMRRLAELVNIRLFVGWIDLYDSVGLEALSIYQFANVCAYIYIYLKIILAWATRWMKANSHGENLIKILVFNSLSCSFPCFLFKNKKRQIV